MENSLITLQVDAIAALHEPRTSEKRHRKYRTKIYRELHQALLKKGFSVDEVRLAIKDTKDMYELERDADED